jgi:hypothetical protein
MKILLSIYLFTTVLLTQFFPLTFIQRVKIAIERFFLPLSYVLVFICLVI